jgi:hypothetical protein
MDYICSFLVYLTEMLQKHYHPESRKEEVTLPSVNGAEKYKPERIFTKRKRIFEFIIEMRYNFKLAVNTLGYGLQLNHQIEQFLDVIFHQKEICL